MYNAISTELVLNKNYADFIIGLNNSLETNSHNCNVWNLVNLSELIPQSEILT